MLTYIFSQTMYYILYYYYHTFMTFGNSSLNRKYSYAFHMLVL